MERRRRLDGIDFWRGCVLCMIFVDHMPGNALENLTPRNFGFSDAAEAFVFLSGMSIALAYGGRFAAGERLRTLRGLARRVAKLYGAHIGLSLAALTIFFGGAALLAEPGLLEAHGRDLFVDNPGLGLLGLMSLGHQLGYFNILPLYIVLIACVPALLLIASIDCRLMLASSAVLYQLVRTYHWSLPNWPGPGSWFFDPLAWQFLFAIGVAVGLKASSGPLPAPRSLTIIAAVIVAASALVVTHGLWVASDTAWRDVWDWARAPLALGKSELGLARLVHFLAAAYLIYATGVAARFSGIPGYRMLTRLGRNSLNVFALISVSSALWQTLAEHAARTIWLDLALAAAGLAAVYLVVRAIEAAGRSADGDARHTDVGAHEPQPLGLRLRQQAH